MPTSLILVRHGESRANNEKFFAGQLDGVVHFFRPPEFFLSITQNRENVKRFFQNLTEILQRILYFLLQLQLRCLYETEKL